VRTGNGATENGADVHSTTRREGDVITRARAQGFDLVQRETDTGNLVWSWRMSDVRPQPSFLSRRMAIDYMAAVLDRIAA
jgi:hypothetical protein